VFVVPPPPANENARLEFLHACGIMDTPRDERFDRVTRLAARFYQADVAFLGFIDERYQWMKSATSDGVAPWIERDKSVCQIVIASGEPLVFGDMRTDPRLDGHPVVPYLPFRFYAGVPLLTEDGAAVASLCVLKRDAQDASQVDLGALTDLGAVAMDELELWRHNRELAHLAETCALTGLRNRRGFDTALDRAVLRARRTATPLSLLLIDLDYFKLLNDARGHQAGDDVLRVFGRILGSAVRRPDDVAARYGGEEFALILPDTDKAGATDIARSIRKAVAEAAMPHPHGVGERVTASIGIVVADPSAALDSETLIARADTALYRAKQSGRDCCVVDE